MVDLDVDVDGTTLAPLLGITLRRLQQLAQDGTIPRSKSTKRGKFRLTDAVSAYIAFIKRDGVSETEADRFTTMRTRLAAAQAETVEMKNAVTRRELAPVAVIEQVIARCAAHAADVLDGIPVALKREVPDIDMRVIRIIEREVAKARTIAADAKLELPEEP